MKYLKKKPRKTKDPLLQTYFVSLLSLVLCMAMFLGTTFAWFTSDVTSAGNQIYVGTLSVGLSQSTDGQTWAAVSDAPVQTAAVGSGNPNLILDPDIRWEPGYTFVKWLQVKNEGELSFRYRLKMSGTDPNNVLGTIGKYFSVYTYTGAYADYQKPASFENIAQAGSGWTEVGTLDKVLAGKSILSGQLKEKNETVAFAFAIHMHEDAGKETMGAKLEGITVKLEAWQAAGESDSLGGDYDNFVSTQEELAAAFAKGGKVILADDVELTDQLMVPAAKEVYLNLNGHTVSQTKACTGSYEMIANNGTLTVADTSEGGKGKLSFTDNGAGDPSHGWGSYTIRNNGRLVIEGGTVEHLGNQAFATHCILPIYQYNGSMEINGGTISCPGYRSLRLWKGTVVINGGTFVGQVWVHCVADGASLTINGGSFAPCGKDKSSVFVDNEKDNGDLWQVDLAITGGSFATKVGCNRPEALAGCITGGQFTDEAKQGTDPILFSSDFQ